MPLFYLHILAFLVIASFIALMLFVTGDKNRVYLNYVLIVYPFMAISLTANIISVAIFDIITLIFLVAFYKPKKIKLAGSKTYLIMYLLLSIVVVIGIFRAESFSLDTLRAIVEYVSISVYSKILIDECITDSSFFYTVIKNLRFALLFSLVFLAGQFIFGPSFSFEKSTNINVTGGTNIRYPGFFQDPQKYAQFLSALSFLFLVKEEKTSRTPVVNYLVLVLALFAIMFTGGRAAFGGWVLGVLIVLLFGKPQFRFVVIGAVIVLSVAAYHYPDQFAMFNRSADITDSYEFRYSIWKDAFEIFKKNAYTGIGIGNYANYVAIHNPDQYWIADNEITYFDHPESGYLKLLTELGAVGFILAMGMVVYPIIEGLITFFKNRDVNILLLVAAICSWMVGFYTVYSLGDIRIRIMVISLVCLLISRYKPVLPND